MCRRIGQPLLLEAGQHCMRLELEQVGLLEFSF